MASFNKVILMGNLTRDPELRYTPNGMPVANLGVAVNRNWTDKDSGQKREETTFVDVTVFGRTAENVGQYMRKGRPIHIDGRLKLDTWQDRNTGQNRSKLTVIAESVQFLGSRDDQDGGGRDDGYQRDAGYQQQDHRPGRGQYDNGGGYQDGGQYGNGGGGGYQERPASPRPAPAPYDDGPPPDDDVPF